MQPAISITQKITLQWRKAGNLLSFFVSICFPESIETYDKAAEVGNVLALCCITIDVQCINRIEFVELLYDFRSTLRELDRIIRKPPSFQVSFRVILPALIVEAMRH